jgi:broad specificity phosphatase PhoE
MHALYASTLRRARETSEIVGHMLGLEPHLDERLREGGLGVLTGLTMDDIERHYPDIWHQWQVNPFKTLVPGGEKDDAFRRRVTSAIEEIVNQHYDGERVGIISHGGTFGLYLMHLLGMDMRRRQPFCFANASITIVRVGGIRPRITRLNDTCHLMPIELNVEV